MILVTVTFSYKQLIIIQNKALTKINHVLRGEDSFIDSNLKMASFAGTTQKCKVCEKKVYWMEQLTADHRVYHKSCFRCHHCKGNLKVQHLLFIFCFLSFNEHFFSLLILLLLCLMQLSNYCSFEGDVYCKPHFDQLFKITGYLDKSFEGEQFLYIFFLKHKINTHFF